MATSKDAARRDEIKRLKRELKDLRTAIEKKPEDDPSVKAARISASAAIVSAEKTSKRSMIAAIVGAVLAMTSALGVAVVNSTHESTTKESTSSSSQIDCTDETKQAIDIYKTHPEITIPYADNDPAQQLCQLNQRIDQVRAIDSPP